MEDLSDRECAQFLRENTAAKWFCGFTLSEPTPDYSLMCRVRKRIGTKRLSTLFSVMRKQLSQHGMAWHGMAWQDVRADNCSCVICTSAIHGGRMPILHRYMDVTY